MWPGFFYIICRLFPNIRGTGSLFKPENGNGVVFLVRSEYGGREIRFVGRVRIELCFQAEGRAVSVVSSALAGLFRHAVAGIELYAGQICENLDRKSVV